jgi:tRNA(Ile)-lysidine synthase
VGHEGQVELAKLEVLSDALGTAMAVSANFRRTLAGAMVSLQRDTIIVERAPPRRNRPGGLKLAGAPPRRAVGSQRK